MKIEVLKSEFCEQDEGQAPCCHGGKPEFDFRNPGCVRKEFTLECYKSLHVCQGIYKSPPPTHTHTVNKKIVAVIGCLSFILGNVLNVMATETN